MSKLILKRAINSWADVGDWQRKYAVTLSLKQFYINSAGWRIPLNADRASMALAFFLRQLNAAVFGNAARRYGKHVRCFAVLERGYNGHLHYHLVLDCPRAEQERDFATMIRTAWLKSDWARHQMEIKACDECWPSYMSKLKTKLDEFGAAFDWENSDLRAC